MQDGGAAQKKGAAMLKHRNGKVRRHATAPAGAGNDDAVFSEDVECPVELHPGNGESPGQGLFRGQRRTGRNFRADDLPQKLPADLFLFHDGPVFRAGPYAPFFRPPRIISAMPPRAMTAEKTKSPLSFSCRSTMERKAASSADR